MITRVSFEKLILDKSAVTELGSKSRDELSALLGEGFAAMKNYDQNNPHHCYDLLTHTLYTVNNLDTEKCGRNDSVFIKAAAMFHDIAKPKVAQLKNGMSVFYGHASKSAEIAEGLLLRIGYDNVEASRICFFIKHHDDFISFKESNHEIKHVSPYIRIIGIDTVEAQMLITKNDAVKNGTYIPDKHDYLLLINLCKADASAQSEYVERDGSVVDGRQAKLSRMNKIEQIIKELPWT